MWNIKQWSQRLASKQAFSNEACHKFGESGWFMFTKWSKLVFIKFMEKIERRLCYGDQSEEHDQGRWDVPANLNK